MYLNAAMAPKKHHIPPDTGDSANPEDTGPDFRNLLVCVGQNRDKESFIQIFEYFAPRVKSFLMRGGMNIDDADELAQETMLTVWDKAASYDPAKASASTWIYTIARNKKIDTLRKASRNEGEITEPAILEDASADQAADFLARQESEAIGKALDDLPEDQAELLQKSFFEHKSHGEIAEETGLPLGTVKSRIRLALQKLKNKAGVRALQ